MKKVILFSHESDIDGVDCAVLAKLAFKNLDIILLPNPDKLEKLFREMFLNNKLDKYDFIFITDLALNKPAIDLVNDSNLKDKIQILDHHQTAIDNNLDKYSFSTIIENDEKGKKCGTTLFYEYLLNQGYLQKNVSLNTFAEYTLLEDTWQWKKYKEVGVKAHDLAILLNTIGKEKYIEIITNILLKNKNEFFIGVKEQEIIDKKKKEYEEQLRNLSKEVKVMIDEDGNKYGAVFANYEYRNELAEYVTSHNENEIKYIIIVALDKDDFGQKSYRAVEKGFDISKIAEKHGGGGHKEAAGVNINKEQNEQVKKMNKDEALKYICEVIYK